MTIGRSSIWLAGVAMATLGLSGTARAGCSTNTPSGGATHVTCGDDTVATNTTNSERSEDHGARATLNVPF